MTNDLVTPTSKGLVAILILLGISAVGQSSLLLTLRSLCTCDTAPVWFSSYLANWSFSVFFSGSSPSALLSIPVGSLPGLLLFSVYIATLSKPIFLYGFRNRLYTDSTQIYLSLPELSHGLLTDFSA